MSDWRGTRALVTGGAGFVGANLVEALQRRGADVHLIVRPQSARHRLDHLSTVPTIHVADLTDAAAVSAALACCRPDVVFHAAAASGHPDAGQARIAAVADTVSGTVALCDAIKATSVRRLVHLGSALEYGPSTAPIAESAPQAPVTFRGATKAAASLVIDQCARETSVPVTHLRLFSLYGPHEHPSRFVPSIMRALIEGGELPLTPPGVRHDFVHVRDAVEACVLAGITDTGAHAVINVGNGEAWTNEGVVELAQQVTGRRLRVQASAYAMRTVDRACGQADISRACALLGWRPRMSLAAGLRDTFEWWLQQAGATPGVVR